MAHQVVIGSLPSLYCHEVLASCCFQKSTATLDGVADTLGGQFLDFSVNKAFEAPVDTHHLHSVEDGATCHRTDTGIHSWSISSRCQDSYSFDFL